MVELAATIRNAHGIHCRPSAAIVKALTGYTGDVQVSTDGGSCDPRSIMGLLALCLHEGTPVTVRVEGPEEEAVARRVVELLEMHYDFPPRREGENTQVILQELGARLPDPPP